MSFDNSQIPVSGSVLLAGAIYAGTCLFVTGPLVAERTIERSGWPARCEAMIVESVELTKKPARVIPRTDCRSIIGSFLPQLGSLCDQYGNPDLSGGATEALRRAEANAQALEERRLAQAVSQSASKCGCASAIVAENSAWAIHAGTWRLSTPSSLNHLDGALLSAVRNPLCAGTGERS